MGVERERLIGRRMAHANAEMPQRQAARGPHHSRPWSMPSQHGVVIEPMGTES